MSENKPTPTEQKIMIASGFSTEKIAMIRELMEEEAIAFLKWATCDNNETNIKRTYSVYKLQIKK